MDVVTGVRVVRGPDWKWTWRKLVSRASRLAHETRRTPEDGGEGNVANVGTVADIQQPADASRYGRVPKIGLWGLHVQII